MPRFDKTGPAGQGPMTGRGLGECADNSSGSKKGDCGGSPRVGSIGDPKHRELRPHLGRRGGRGFGRGRNVRGSSFTDFTR